MGASGLISLQRSRHFVCDAMLNGCARVELFIPPPHSASHALTHTFPFLTDLANSATSRGTGS
ncbi:hypothetical protein PSP6_630035 [Paraburkholderia tropica]|nr:hypothetical protein PSP6_630035 [Paraburkholderia tropica]